MTREVVGDIGVSNFREKFRDQSQRLGITAFGPPMGAQALYEFIKLGFDF
jgi:hypothetical protein